MARCEGIHTVLRGMTLVISKPREVVLRRIPSSVQVEVVNDELAVGDGGGVPLV